MIVPDGAPLKGGGRYRIAAKAVSGADDGFGGEPAAVSVLRSAYRMRGMRHDSTMLCRYRAARMMGVAPYALSVPDSAYRMRRRIGTSLKAHFLWCRLTSSYEKEGGR
eukprot:3060086-Rhodomonas_salina.2